MSTFDERAKSWDDLPDRRERAEAVAKAIRKEVRLTPDMTALEYGSGTGLLSFALQPYLGSITLADSSTGMLEVAQEKIAASGVRNIVTLKLDLSTDPLPAQRFDLVYSLMVLHHIPEPFGVLQKLHGLLKSQGILCIADLDAEDGTFHEGQDDVHHGFGQAEMTGLLARTGFEHIHFTTPYSVEKHGRMYPLFLAVGNKP